MIAKRAGEGEPAVTRADRFAHDAVKVRTDAIGTALFDGVASRALRKNLFAGCRIGTGKQGAEIGPGIGTTIFGYALDEKSRLFDMRMLIRSKIHA